MALTNEQAKQEAIKKAYGEHWEKVKNKVRFSSDARISGYSLPQDVGMPSHSEVQYDWENDDWRPMQLMGIEDNNGWIRIEPDGSNLPKQGEYRWLFESGNMADFYYEPGDIMSVKATHYKPITPELKPIY